MHQCLLCTQATGQILEAAQHITQLLAWLRAGCFSTGRDMSWVSASCAPSSTRKSSTSSMSTTRALAMSAPASAPPSASWVLRVGRHCSRSRTLSSAPHLRDRESHNWKVVSSWPPKSDFQAESRGFWNAMRLPSMQPKSYQASTDKSLNLTGPLGEGHSCSPDCHAGIQAFISIQLSQLLLQLKA